MKVSALSQMGNDLTVANSARVSFDKKSELVFGDEMEPGDVPVPVSNGITMYLPERDVKLIRYLAAHQHWTPFAHPQISFHIEAPIFVARQLFKHKVGVVENEVSRRYVSGKPRVWCPGQLRLAHPNKKQGSLDQTTWEGSIEVPVLGNDQILLSMSEVMWVAIDMYEKLIEEGVCPEQARAVLPLGTYTEWHATGSLYYWFNVFRLRNTSDAQRETAEIARQIDEILAKLYPVSWTALKDTL